MKRLFSLLTFVFLAASSWAQHWTPKTNQDYPDENAYYIRLSVNGSNVSEGAEVAAFIDGECRATATNSNKNSIGLSVYTLRVAGDFSTERGKEIKFKVRYNNLDYAINFQDTIYKSVTKFTDVTNPPSSSIRINVDALTGVKVTDPIEVNAPESAFPYQVNINEKVKYIYGSENYPPSNESVCETELLTNCQVLTPSGAPVSGFSYSDGVLTINKPIEGNFLYRYSVYTPDGSVNLPYTGTLNVKLAVIPVTNMTVSKRTFALYTNDNFKEMLKKYVTITPSNATHQDFIVMLADGDTLRFGGEKFRRGGSYELIVKSTDPNYGKTVAIDADVYEHPYDINAKDTAALKVGLGENVEDVLMKNVILSYVNEIEKWFYDDSLDVKIISGAEYLDEWNMSKTPGQVVAQVSVRNGLTDMDFTTVDTDKYVTLTVNIVSNLKITFTVNTNKFFKNGQPSDVSPVNVSVSNPNNEPFDKSLLTISFPDRYEGFPYAEMVSVNNNGYNEMGVSMGYSFTILPKFVGRDLPYTVAYDGKPIEQVADPSMPSMPDAKLTIAGVENLEQGWNWMAVNSIADPMVAMAVAGVFSALNDIEQVRSQKLMVYNDPSWGLFGDLETITPADAMYKVNALNATTVNLGSYNCFETNQNGANFNKGYNWINNPCEFDVMPSQFNSFLGFTPEDGDIIITQDGFATYSSGSWIADSNFSLKAGKGFIYFVSAEKSMTVSGIGASIKPIKADSPSGLGKKIAKRNDNYFSYNVHAFADKMAMIARVEGLTDAENYEIGVFVGDECRGMGKVVADDILFINAVGEKGELMTFKLYNKQTGELSEIDEAVKCELVNGSIAAPAVLHAPQATGIRSLNAGKLQADDSIYDLSGRRVERATKGLYIKNGKTVIVK